MLKWRSDYHDKHVVAVWKGFPMSISICINRNISALLLQGLHKLSSDIVIVALLLLLLSPKAYH